MQRNQANRYEDRKLIPIDLKNCQLYLIDGTGNNFIAIRIGEGTLTYSVKRDIQQRKSRGNLWQLREGEQQPTDVQFQFVWDFITSSGDEPPTIEDVLYGTAEGWVSASNSFDQTGPFTVNLQIVNTVPCFGPSHGSEMETHNFPLFAFTSLDHSLKDATVDCKGVSNRPRPIVIRS